MEDDMAIRKKISKEQYENVLKAIKKNKHKKIDRKLQIIKLRYEGLSNIDISKKLNCCQSTISKIVSTFLRESLEEFSKLNYRGNNRSLTEEEEDEILKEFNEKSEKGQIVTVKEIKAAFDKKIGKDTGRGYIYMLLKRKGYRKVMPRNKHPKKASKEVISTSKKLKFVHENSC